MRNTRPYLLFPAAAVCLCLGAACNGTSSGIHPGPAQQASAPVTGFSPGIGGPGANSADTRGQGAVAPGEAVSPVSTTNIPSPASASGH